MIRLVTELSHRQREWRNDPRVMAMCRQNELISEEDQKRWLERIKTDSTIKMFGVEAELDVPNLSYNWTTGVLQQNQLVPVLVGTAALTSITRVHRTAEFSLFIAPEYQGKGLGRAALLELLKYGFCNMNLATIWGETFVGNPAMKLFESVGFHNEGLHVSRYEKDGKRIDAYSISMTHDQYFAKHSS